jgi:hypothetical protein
MYLVELEAGREELYQSVDALGSAIRRGDIGPQSRIFHRASASWISITVHPEYRKASAERASEPLPPLTRTQWTFFGVEPRRREIAEAEPSADTADSPAPPDEGPRGLRGLLRRALNLSPSPSPTETAAD